MPEQEIDRPEDVKAVYDMLVMLFGEPEGDTE